MKRCIPILIALMAPCTAGAEALSECAEIESAVARLDCYDKLARQNEPEAPVTEEAPTASNTPVKPADVFGKKIPRPDENLQLIRARIEHIEKTPLGHHILTLSNGQVWVENEPGRRSIEADQDITIRKHRFHFEMELEGRPDVPVRRVE